MRDARCEMRDASCEMAQRRFDWVPSYTVCHSSHVFEAAIPSCMVESPIASVPALITSRQVAQLMLPQPWISCVSELLLAHLLSVVVD